MPQVMRSEGRRQPCRLRLPHEGLPERLHRPAGEQMPVVRRPVLLDVGIDVAGHPLRQGHIPELARLPVLKRSQPKRLVEYLLADAQRAAEYRHLADGERLSDPKAAAAHERDQEPPVTREGGRHLLKLAAGGHVEFCGLLDRGQPDALGGVLRDPLRRHGLAQDGRDNEPGGIDDRAAGRLGWHGLQQERTDLLAGDLPQRRVADGRVDVVVQGALVSLERVGRARVLADPGLRVVAERDVP